MTRGIPGSGRQQPHGTLGRSMAGCDCTRCRPARARAQKRINLRRAQGDPITVPSVGIARRLQALQWMRWSSADIAPLLGVTPTRVRQLTNGTYPTACSTTLRRVRAVYDDLSMRTGPSERAHAWAVRQGYVPPLAWDDTTIDDPTARPVRDTFRARRAAATVIDHVAIERAMNGDLGVRLTQAERRIAVQALTARGLSDQAIATRLGVTDRAILRNRQHLGIPAVAVNQWSAAS